VVKSPVVKSPELDKRERFGSSSSGETPAARRVAATPKDTIANFSVVMLQHKGTPFRVRLTKVVTIDLKGMYWGLYRLHLKSKI